VTGTQTEAGDFAVDATARTVRGLLMPWGETSRMSVSGMDPIAFERGTIDVPADFSVIGANRNHDRYDPVGRATSIEDTDRGLVATFAIARTPEGDELLRQIERGEFRKLSAEVAGIVRRGAQAVRAKLTGSAFVPEGAFQSAALFAVGEVQEATDADPVTTEDKSSEEYTDADGKKWVRETVTTTVIDGDTTTITTVTNITEPPTEQDTDVTAATVPAAAFGAHTAATPREPSKAEFLTMLAAHDTGMLPADARASFSAVASSTGLFAGLSDIKYDGTGGITTALNQPQWIGEVWDGNDWQQKYVPLFEHADLNSLEFLGYKWDVKPHGGDWAGNKSDVPSNSPKFKPVKGTAGRYAMGHDIARELRDLKVFGDTSFFDAYFKAGAEDYAKWVDTKTLAAALEAAVSLKADDPAGLDVGPAMSALVDGAAAVIAANATPTFALVELSYWKQIAKTPAKDILGYLNAQLGLTTEAGTLDNFKLIPTTDLEARNVLVGSGKAMTVRELPGVPIRIDALDVARGGEDHALFGYAGVQVNKPDALQLVTPYTAS
jgi:hypothetical protein